MFCIKSDVINLESLEIYESHEMRHTGFPLVDGGQWDLRVGASQYYL